MKLITAIIIICIAIIVIAATGWTATCQQGSLVTLADDGGNNVAIKYECDDGTETRVIKTNQGTDEKTLIRMLTGKNCIDVPVLNMTICEN